MLCRSHHSEGPLPSSSAPGINTECQAEHLTSSLILYLVYFRCILVYFTLSVRNDQGHRQRYNITIAHNCIQYPSIHHPPDIIFHHGRQRPSLEHCSATRCLHNPLLVAFSVVAALAPVGKAECHSFLSALRHNSRQVPEPNTCEGQCH